MALCPRPAPGFVNAFVPAKPTLHGGIDRQFYIGAYPMDFQTGSKTFLNHKLTKDAEMHSRDGRPNVVQSASGCCW